MVFDQEWTHPESQPERPSTACPTQAVETGALLDIGSAVALLWTGQRVRRKGWNGKGMWLELQFPGADARMTLPYVFMSTAQGDLVPWLCSQTDLLAQDWEQA